MWFGDDGIVSRGQKGLGADDVGAGRSAGASTISRIAQPWVKWQNR